MSGLEGQEACIHSQVTVSWFKHSAKIHTQKKRAILSCANQVKGIEFYLYCFLLGSDGHYGKYQSLFTNSEEWNFWNGRCFHFLHTHTHKHSWSQSVRSWSQSIVHFPCQHCNFSIRLRVRADLEHHRLVSQPVVVFAGNADWRTPRIIPANDI